MKRNKKSKKIMNNLELIKEKIKSLLKFADSTCNVETKDGTKLLINDTDAVVGAEIFNVDANGVQSPVQDGEYELTDGRTIAVSGGKITDVKAPADNASGNQSPVEPAPTSTQSMADPTATAAPTAETPDDSTEPVNPAEDTTEDATDMETRVAALETQLSQVMDMLNQLTSNSQTMMERVEKMAAQPATTGIQPKKVELSSNVSSKGTIDLNEINEIRKKIRKSN